MNRKTTFAAALEGYIFARDALNNQPQDTTHEQGELLSDAYQSAHERLITTPAADVSDLRAKMETMWEDPAATPLPHHMQAVMQDLLVLTDLEPSRTFNADTWLHHFERFGGGWIERSGELVLMVPHGSTDGYTQDAIADLMFTLEACHGRFAVIEAIRAKTQRLAA